MVVKNLIVKNTTVSDIFLNDLKVNLLANNDPFIIPYENLGRWSTSTDIYTHLASGDVIINDGFQDIAVADAVAVLQSRGTALQLFFQDDSTRGNFFDARSIQEATEEIDFRQIIKDPTGHKDRSETTLSFNDGNLTFTLGLTGADATVYNYGKEIVINSTLTSTITDTSGEWFFVINAAGALESSQTRWVHGNAKVHVATGLWSSIDQEMILLYDNRIGISMDWSTRETLEHGGPTLSRTGFTITDTILNADGSLATHATFGLTGGEFHNEDIEDFITHSASPTNPFEQRINTTTYIPMYYRSGSAGEWRKLTATQFAMATNAGTPYYNEWTGSTWQLTNMPENSYAASIVAVTANFSEPVIGVVPQFVGTNTVDATRNVLNNTELGGFPIKDAALLVLGVYEGAASFTNVANARYVAFSDIGGLETSIDRYAILASYTGNANPGRYLEVIPGTGSNTDPFYVPEDSFIRTVTAQSPALESYVVGFYENNDLVNPRLTLTVSNADNAIFDVSTLFVSGESISVKIVSGNVGTPAVRFWVQTAGGA